MFGLSRLVFMDLVRFLNILLNEEGAFSCLTLYINSSFLKIRQIKLI